MISIGLVGLGKFGHRVEQLIKDDSSLNFLWSIDSKSLIKDLQKPDWVYICSPNELHFEHAIEFMRMGCNIILEKPPAFTHESVESLIVKSKQYNVNIYFSMVYLFDNEIDKINDPRAFTWHKFIKSDNYDGAFWALTYHDIYIYLNKNPGYKPDDLKVINCEFFSPDKFCFEIKSPGGTCRFDYSRTETSNYYRSINDHPISRNKTDTINRMLSHVISIDSFEENKNLALNTSLVLEKVRKNLFPKKLVVGGGIFGCSSAIGLSKLGYQVDLVERNKDIMQEASSINQYRIHRGYHYPRSDETVSQCQDSFRDFEKMFQGALVGKKYLQNSFYAIAAEDSKVSSDEYIEFLERNNLNYKKTQIGLKNISLTVEVQENLFDPFKLKSILEERMFSLGVDVRKGYKATKKDFKNYHGGVIATYANQGYWDDEDKIYQFELCEKPIAQLPAKYKGLSIVIMDGPFMCIDPYMETDFHVMGNVVHAIHSTNLGKEPKIPNEYIEVLNQGIIQPPKHLTKFDKFIKSAKKFFPNIEDSVHIGSMYTVRAVESNRDYDDARLTSEDKISDNFFKIFSGKVCTSISSSKRISTLTKARDNTNKG